MRRYEAIFYQAMAYGILMENNEINQARSVLNNLPLNDAGEIEFVDVQNIYLDYLADKSNYVLNPTKTSLIYNAGLRKHPLAGFARSVYHTLTGQKVPVTLTHMNGNVHIRSKEPINAKVSIYPNPSENGVFNVEVDNFANETDDVDCIVYNIYGQQLFAKKLNQKNSLLEFQNASSGLYLIRILVNQIPIATEKVIIK